MTSTAHDLNRERQWVCARRMSGRRHDLGLTQRDVVERLASLGLTTTNRTLSAMEHGQGVDVGRLPELAVVLDTTVTYLLGLTADPRSWLPDGTAAPTVSGPQPLTAAVPARMPGPASVTCALCAAEPEHAEPAHAEPGHAGPRHAGPRHAGPRRSGHDPVGHHRA